MGAVTILKWEQDLNGWMKAVTKVGTWYAHEDGHWRLPDSWGATMTNGNLGGAKAICEADYIQRCTEFLHLYNPATHEYPDDGYVKLEPGQVVVDTKVWLPYLVKAINAAKILQKHGAFTVKHYHGDWPSLEMLEGLKRAIDGQIKGEIMGQYERKPVTTKRGESDWTACRYPDGNPNHYPMGFGETEQQALDDLEEVEGQFDRVCRMNGYRRVGGER